MACDSRREYYIIQSKFNREIFWMIYQETQRWYVLPSWEKKETLLQSAKHYKIRESQSNTMQPDWLAAGIWQARKMRLQKSTGNDFTFLLMNNLKYLSWNEGWWGWGQGSCWASTFRKWSRNPCLGFEIISVITACSDALSFLGKDLAGLADLGSQCGGWWKRDPVEASARRLGTLKLWILRKWLEFQS